MGGFRCNVLFNDCGVDNELDFYFLFFDHFCVALI